MFSSSSDKNKYDGGVPSGSYLSKVYKQFSKSIDDYLGKEAKKRGAQVISLDA
jgi:hypothetical protein